jgi:outer membrane biosynthesis protein TonB
MRYPTAQMASESLTPPPASGGGYAKYLIILLLILGGGLGVFFATRKEPEAAKPTPPPPPKVERSTALSNDTIEIPEEEPVEDAAVAAPEPTKKPRPAGDPWECAGDLAPAEIRRVLGQEQGAIRACYERQLRNNNMLQGDVVLQVRIGNDGKVAATRVRGNLKDNDVKSCMQKIAGGWSFPAPSGGTCAVFEAPFHFTPKQ